MAGQDLQHRLRSFVLRHGWALPSSIKPGHHNSPTVAYRSVGSASEPGLRATLDNRGTLHPSLRGASLEFWWRTGQGPVRRLADLPDGSIRQSRISRTQGVATQWQSDGMAFRLLTSIVELEGVRIAWHHLQAAATGESVGPVQFIGALRPFAIAELGVIGDLAYHTTGLFLSGGKVVLYDAAARPDGIRISNADLGDSLQLIEGTMPPEGGLSVRDLREKSLRTQCSLGLCSGATTTITEMDAGAVYSRWWAMPLGPVKPEELPLHLLTEELCVRLLKEAEEDLPLISNMDWNPSATRMGHSVSARLREFALSEDESHGMGLPPAQDLPVLVRAAALTGSGNECWRILSRWLMHQSGDGLLVYGSQDPLSATTSWLAATLLHLHQSPVLTGSRSPFPSEDPWPRAIRLAIMGVGQEYRLRSREGWLRGRHGMGAGAGEDHAGLAHALFALGRMAALRDVVITREESAALLRIHGEIRQILSHSLAQALEHAPDGLIPPGVGIPFCGDSVCALEALFLLEADDRPASESTLKASVRALYRLADRDPSGLLRDGEGWASPQLTLRLIRLLFELGHRPEAERLFAAVNPHAWDSAAGEWPRVIGGVESNSTSSIPTEDLSATAMAFILSYWMEGSPGPGKPPRD